MADRYHLSGATDWSLAASWHDGVYGASAVPLDGENVYFLEGSDNVTTGMTLAGAGDSLALISESAGFSGSVGTAGTPLAMAATNANSLVFNKGGPGRWNVSGQIPTLRMRNGYLGVFTGEVLDATVTGGELYIADSCDLNTNTLLISGGASVTIDYRASDSPVITVNDGTLILRRLFGAMVINGGRVVVEVMKSISSSTSITMNGGELDYRAGYVSTLTPKGGHITFANQTKPITVANAVSNLGARFTARNGGNGLAVTYTGGFTEVVPGDSEQA